MPAARGVDLLERDYLLKKVEDGLLKKVEDDLLRGDSQQSEGDQPRDRTLKKAGDEQLRESL